MSSVLRLTLSGSKARLLGESGGAKLEAGTSVRKQEQWSGERGGHLKRWDVAQQDSPMGSIVGSKRRQDRTKADAPIFILSSWLMAGALY